MKFIFHDEESGETFEYCYENGIVDYIKEVSEEKSFTDIQFFEKTTKGRDRADKPEYKVKMEIAFVLIMK